MGQQSLPGAADTERLAYLAVDPIGGYQILGAQPVLVSVAPPQGRRHPVVVLAEAGQFGVHPDIGAKFDRLVPQYGLEPVLRDSGGGAW